MQPYPPRQVPNPKYLNTEGEPIEGEPQTLEDPNAKYDMNEIFALINCTTSNLRELAEDIGTFSDKIGNAEEKQKRGFNVGNLIRIAPFYALIIILMLKPYGFFGTKDIERV